MPNASRIAGYQDFWPYYLGEHRNATCRRLHFTGTSLVVALVVAAVVTRTWWLLWLVPVAGYGFAWVGHFAFEKNRPATFRYPVYSLIGDWVMYWQLATGKIPFEERNAGAREGADPSQVHHPGR